MEEFWVESIEKYHHHSTYQFQKDSKENALAWISQGYVKRNCKIVVREQSKRTKCCGKLIKLGKIIREINPFANTEPVSVFDKYTQYKNLKNKQ